MNEKSTVTDPILGAKNAAFTGTGNGAGQFSVSGLVPSQVKEIALRGNGYVLAMSGGIAVCLGAVLPFTWHSQASLDGAPLVSGFTIGAGDRVVSFLFGALLAGLAYWTHRSPARRRPIATGALVTSGLGFLGYFLYTVIGINGVTANSDLGPAQVSWYPSIGLLLSVIGCAACVVAATIIRRTSPRR